MDLDTQTLLAQFVRKARLDIRLTRRELARRTGLDTAELVAIEEGEESPRVAVLVWLCRALSEVEGAPIIRVHDLLRQVAEEAGELRAEELRRTAGEIRREVEIKTEWVERDGPPDGWRTGVLALELANAQALEAEADALEAREFAPRPQRLERSRSA